MNVRELGKKIDSILQKGDDRIDSSTISMLLSKVTGHVQVIKEMNELVKERYELEKIIKKLPETPEQEAEVSDAKEKMAKIAQIERQSSDRRRELRDLEKNVQKLLTEIRKAA